jgi:predicted short-subunit dehydrogenase-like oxidoreductase (DUF2520 family)
MANRLTDGRVRKGIAVIGTGNWGSSLAAGVVAVGVPLVEVIIRKVEKARDGRNRVALADARLDAEVIWICVPDGEISRITEQIAARRGDLTGQAVVHSSGALTVDALEAAKRMGAQVGSIAPVFSFPTREPVALAGVLFAVEVAADSGPGTWKKLAALVRKLGGQPLRISSESKVLYHAAATMASPLLVSALHAAVETAQKAGLRKDEAEAVVGVLTQSTAQNYFEKGRTRSFSGAFARGDVGTVELHLRALLEHPKLHRVYLALARNAVGTLSVRNKPAFEKLLQDDKWARGA